jgi:hypothetical protein
MINLVSQKICRATRAENRPGFIEICEMLVGIKGEISEG